MRGGFLEPLHFSSTSFNFLFYAIHNVYVVCNTLCVVFDNIEIWKKIVECKLMLLVNVLYMYLMFPVITQQIIIN